MKNDFLKSSNSRVNTVIDESTGEILSETTSVTMYLANSSKEFYLMYASMLSVLKGSSDPKINLLAGLIERYSKGQEFSMSRGLKDLIAKECNGSSRTFDRAFTVLKEENLIIEVSPRLYRINPKHIFQGSSKNRDKSLKLLMEIGLKNY